MSGKRSSPGRTGPISGFRKVRLMWSAIIMSAPRLKVRRMPPAALVRMSVSDPERREDPDRQDDGLAPCPSYRWNRPLCTSTGRAAERAGHQLALVARRPSSRGIRRSRCREPVAASRDARRDGRGRCPARWRPRAPRPSRSAMERAACSTRSAEVPGPAVTAGCRRSSPRGSSPACRRASRGSRAGRGRASAPAPARRCRRAGCRPS